MTPPLGWRPIPPTVESVAPLHEFSEEACAIVLDCSQQHNTKVRHYSNGSGWVPPTGEIVPKPYRVTRTASNNLPVYTDIRNGRTRILTIVRRIEGSTKALQTDLAYLTGVSVIEKPGKLELKGSYSIDKQETTLAKSENSCMG